MRSKAIAYAARRVTTARQGRAVRNCSVLKNGCKINNAHFLSCRDNCWNAPPSPSLPPSKTCFWKTEPLYFYFINKSSFFSLEDKKTERKKNRISSFWYGLQSPKKSNWLVFHRKCFTTKSSRFPTDWCVTVGVCHLTPKRLYTTFYAIFYARDWISHRWPAAAL